MKIKSFGDYINRHIPDNKKLPKNKIILESEADKYKEVLDELQKMISETSENNKEESDSFIQSFLRDPEEVKIEGLINESDIYEFYLKFRNQIDEILNNVKYYDVPPSERNSFGLYEYIIKGTQYAIVELVKMMNPTE